MMRKINENPPKEHFIPLLALKKWLKTGRTFLMPVRAFHEINIGTYCISPLMEISVDFNQQNYSSQDLF